MPLAAIAIYGIYLIFVGMKGNAGNLASELKKDIGGFVPWLIVVIVLFALYNNDKTKKIAEPLMFLVIVTLIFKNFSTIKTETTKIYDAAIGKQLP